MEAWEHIAPELPPGWTVENSGDMDYMQNWSTRAAEGTVTERGFCGREYAVEDCWEQFGITRRRYAELIAPQRVREAADRVPRFAGIDTQHRLGVAYVFDVLVAGGLGLRVHARGSGPDICTAAWAAIQALGGGE